MNAFDELPVSGDEILAVVFGDWGWDGYGEPDSIPVPEDKRGVILTLSEATQYGNGWKFCGGYGAPDCYATYLWTADRVYWITQYDGSTQWDSAPRNPSAEKAEMPGG